MRQVASHVQELILTVILLMEQSNNAIILAMKLILIVLLVTAAVYALNVFLTFLLHKMEPVSIAMDNMGLIAMLAMLKHARLALLLQF